MFTHIQPLSAPTNYAGVKDLHRDGFGFEIHETVDGFMNCNILSEISVWTLCVTHKGSPNSIFYTLSAGLEWTPCCKMGSKPEVQRQLRAEFASLNTI